MIFACLKLAIACVVLLGPTLAFHLKMNNYRLKNCMAGCQLKLVCPNIFKIAVNPTTYL
jgi:hypothetical protein